MRKYLLGSVLLSVFIFVSCATYPTSMATEKKISSIAFDSEVIISNIQYGYTKMMVSSTQFFYPTDKNMRIAILQFKIVNVQEYKIYDFYDVTLNKDGESLHPSLVRYFKGNSAVGMDWGYKQTIGTTLPLSFNKNTAYTIMLGYICNAEDRFNSITIDGKEVEFENNFTKEMSFIDRFRDPYYIPDVE